MGDWNEGDHPRGPGGKFGEGGASKQPHGLAAWAKGKRQPAAKEVEARESPHEDAHRELTSKFSFDHASKADYDSPRGKALLAAAGNPDLSIGKGKAGTEHAGKWIAADPNYEGAKMSRGFPSRPQPELGTRKYAIEK